MKVPDFVLLAVPVLLTVSCEQNPYKQGARLYEIHCSNCHMADGEGLANLYPPLNTEDFGRTSSKFACLVRYGLDDSIYVDGRLYTFPMPGNLDMNAVEIANVYNYLVHRWHPDLKTTTATKIDNDLNDCTNP